MGPGGRGELTYEMDMGVRLAPSNQGAFGDRECVKNRGLWVRECQIAHKKGYFGDKFAKVFKKMGVFG